MWHSTSIEKLLVEERHTQPFTQPFIHLSANPSPSSFPLQLPLHSYTELYNANLRSEIRIKLCKRSQVLFVILRRSYFFSIHVLFVLLGLVLAKECPFQKSPFIMLPIDSLLLSFTPIFLFFSRVILSSSSHCLGENTTE